MPALDPPVGPGEAVGEMRLVARGLDVAVDSRQRILVLDEAASAVLIYRRKPDVEEAKP